MKIKIRIFMIVLLLLCVQIPVLVQAKVDNLTSTKEWEDGSYETSVTLKGGSGRASIQSPTEIQVKDGQAYGKIVWSSSHYDYMIVDKKKYMPVNSTGNSTFEIPVKEFDTPLEVIADTTAMSVPHEIQYQLEFSSEGLKKSMDIKKVLVLVVLLVGVMIVDLLLGRKRGKKS